VLIGDVVEDSESRNADGRGDIYAAMLAKNLPCLLLLSWTGTPTTLESEQILSTAMPVVVRQAMKLRYRRPRHSAANTMGVAEWSESRPRSRGIRCWPCDFKMSGWRGGLQRAIVVSAKTQRGDVLGGEARFGREWYKLHAPTWRDQTWSNVVVPRESNECSQLRTCDAS
jgi:hypothetical protein